MAIHFKWTETEAELRGILDLQKVNLLSEISEEEKAEQGFVTVRHSLDQLKLMHSLEPHVITKDGEKVIGYILAMTKESRDLVPVLIPMFEQFDRLNFGEKLLSDYDYLVIGQICIDKSYRGQGIFDKMYELYRSTFASRYDFAVTEIALSNFRSLKAHQRVGFKVIHEFDDTTQNWAIVLLDWR
ncbi:GNAT family N-acetyltransferase [Algoriphagus boritolerans]|uniref:Acetyltransferase (GNAT) domain-containing protein n=1 Tax=Algoriphagus boritolerans DSM 17298 = JCM 18970 TaxID=1120964 RepID=A0A1H5ZJA9_9BACT|nr:GNAT family N-acetyltransferase [Algoriphagus boritolerans]SEG36588.1 Acetyltransferase (GNAT) domain-containing protein [Algoriphagus boritolerans DSM 17298 = JCM 18970]